MKNKKFTWFVFVLPFILTNFRGEVTEGKRYTPSNTSIDGLEREYTYDEIGNRTSAKFGKNSALSEIGYTVNGHNQYSAISHPDKAWVVGRAPELDDVYVNTQLATRQETWFSKELTVANSSGPVKQSVLVEDDLGTDIAEGDVEVPAANNSSIQYDEAGNLANDGRWLYHWDSENRLRKMTSIASGFPSRTVEFVYDWQGKRIAKKVAEGASVRHTRYLYEGWNVVAEWTLHGSSTTLNTPQTYLWGLDLAGQSSGNVSQLQAAGGVGGLLAVDVRKVSDATAAGKVYASYDGNGNILAWSGADGLVKRTQDYDAFGNVVLKNTASSGTLSDGNGEVAYGFSTKPEDQESGLLYYGYRYFDPVPGRWSSKDPPEEEGGINLYNLLRGNAVNSVDKLGLVELKVEGSFTLPELGKGWADKIVQKRNAYYEFVIDYKCSGKGPVIEIPAQKAEVSFNGPDEFNIGLSAQVGPADLGVEMGGQYKGYVTLRLVEPRLCEGASLEKPEYAQFIQVLVDVHVVGSFKASGGLLLQGEGGFDYQDKHLKRRILNFEISCCCGETKIVRGMEYDHAGLLPY
jgi:RHS repeat-associated protein